MIVMPMKKFRGIPLVYRRLGGGSIKVEIKKRGDFEFNVILSLQLKPIMTFN